jgi:hypothetical protein
VNRMTISAPASRRAHFYSGRFAASRLFLQMARALVWLLAIVLALLSGERRIARPRLKGGS